MYKIQIILLYVVFNLFLHIKKFLFFKIYYVKIQLILIFKEIEQETVGISHSFPISSGSWQEIKYIVTSLHEWSEINLYTGFRGLWSHLVMFRTYSWLWIRGSLFAGLRGPDGVSEIKPGSSACKTSTWPAIVSLWSLCTYFKAKI